MKKNSILTHVAKKLQVNIRNIAWPKKHLALKKKKKCFFFYFSKTISVIDMTFKF